jgi:hypothetical protein
MLGRFSPVSLAANTQAVDNGTRSLHAALDIGQ